MSARPAQTRAPEAYTPDVTSEGAPEPTEVRLVGVDAQVVSPAWELELLVTGIVLVGLFQIPPWLQGIWRHWEPHLSLIGGLAARSVLLATDAALYALIICFVVALALRGYWVALVGVNSVFPHGVRWDKQREYGPIQADLAKRRVRALPAFIGRANDMASLVYATGFVLAALAVASLGIVAVTVATFGVLAALLPLKAALWVFITVSAAFGLAIAGAAVIDMRRGATLPPGSRQEYLVRAVLRAASGLTPDGVRSLSAVLTSNVNKRVAYTAVALGFGGAYLSASGAMSGVGGLPGGSNYTYFTEDRRAGVVTADLYDALRADPDAPTGLPSIQSDVVTDPYVRLFVPYRPQHHGPALERACPTVQRPPVDGDTPAAATADAAVLACAAKLHAVALDGRPVASRFRFFTNPRTERRGFLMLIPASMLAAGEHVLTVRPARRDVTPADTIPIRIPFWR